MSNWCVLEGDCLDALRDCPDEYFDAMVTDPPAGVSFMGRDWDSDKGGRDQWIAWLQSVMVEVYRCLKPGAHCLVWALPRTSHWTATAIEDAGFEVRDVIHALQGQGFPKSHSVSKALIPKVEFRYGKQTCLCLENEESSLLDTGDGCAVGNDAGFGSGSSDRLQRECAQRSTDCAGNSVLSINKSPNDDSVRDLWQSQSSQSGSFEAKQEVLLLQDVRGCWSEATGLGNASLRTRLEESTCGSETPRPELSDLREDSRAERPVASCSSPEALPDGRDQSPRQPRGSVRLMSSSAGVADGSGVELHPDRSLPRRLITDDQGGRREPVARVCSWCGLPDQGWLSSLEPLGSALKPATEHWILARKPLAASSIARNVLQHGTGALNIDACRVDRASDDVPGWHKSGSYGRTGGYLGTDTFKIRDMPPEEVQARCGNKGRWPTNLLLSHSADCEKTGTRTVKTTEDGLTSTVEEDIWECAPDCPVAELNRQSGVTKSGSGKFIRKKTLHDTEAGWGMRHEEDAGQGYGDSGGASRFFPTFHYFPKPSRREREAGLDDLPDSTLHRVNPGGLENEPRFAPVQVKNNHPTVKGIELCRWLSRLICPPGGRILDPFAGSGSIGCAAVLEGFDYVGTEKEPEYCEIARARIEYWAAKGGDSK